MPSPDPTTPTSGRRQSPAVLIGVVVAVIVLLVIGFFAFGGRSMLQSAGVLPATNPDVGECIIGRTDHEAVDCDDPQARYKVKAVLDIPAEGATRETCAVVEGATGMILTTNNSNKVLCVAELGGEGA